MSSTCDDDTVWHVNCPWEHCPFPGPELEYESPTRSVSVSCVSPHCQGGDLVQTILIPPCIIAAPPAGLSHCDLRAIGPTVGTWRSL